MYRALLVPSRLPIPMCGLQDSASPQLSTTIRHRASPSLRFIASSLSNISTPSAASNLTVPRVRCAQPLQHRHCTVSGVFSGQDNSWMSADGAAVGDDPLHLHPRCSIERRTCQICHKIFRHRESLCNHMEMHRGVTTCPKCGKVLSTKKSLRLHLDLNRCGAGAVPS